MSERILIIAAHPDDEVLGCGGAVARHVDRGDEVYSLILAEGATSRGEGHGKELSSLQKAAGEAAHILGAQPPRFAGLADNRMDSYDFLDVVKIVEKTIEELTPTRVYTHHAGDLNVDHRIAHQATVTACRALPGASVCAIYAFETVSSTEWASPILGNTFTPNYFVDIDAYLERKLRALDCYQSEMREMPHPRSSTNVAALATVRGATVGVTAAEAFELVREIVK